MSKILMSILALGALSTNVYGACTAGGCSNVVIDKVLVARSGDILVSTDATETALDCNPIIGEFMTISVDNPGKNAMYSMFLTAQTTQKQVTLAIVPGTDGCKISYAFIK